MTYRDIEEKKILRASFTTEMVTPPRAGDMYCISGTIYTARSAAYLRLVEILKRDKGTPSNFEGQVVYYAGPCPTKPGQPISSIGPTTGGRMNAYSPTFIAYGLHVMIDRDLRNPEIVDVTKQYKGVCFAVISGAAALIGKYVEEAEAVAFDDLGSEVIHKLHVEEFPVVVTTDSLGGDVYPPGHSQCARR